MAEPKPDQLARADCDEELTKLLRLGYGSMLVKVHGHRIALIETMTRFKRISTEPDEPEPGRSQSIVSCPSRAHWKIPLA